MVIRPRLLWINHYAVAPTEGGGTRHVEMGQALYGLGWDVDIVGSDYHYAKREYSRRADASDRRSISETIGDITVHWLWSAPNQTNNWRRVWNWLTFARSVAQYTPFDRPDLVIGSSPQLFAAVAAARIARRFGVPFILEVRDLWPESLEAASGRRGAAYYALLAVARYLYARAEKIIVLSRGAGQYLADRGIPQAKILYVPNGVDTALFSEPERTGSNPFTIVYAGAHGPANGLDVVLDAAALLRDRVRVRFLLIGDGPVKSQLRADAVQRNLHNVVFQNPIAKKDMPGVLAQADAGLMVLRAAPLFSFAVSPNKLFDYFGAKLPVVCNVPGEVADMIAIAGAGEQAADASAAALADAIERLTNASPSRRLDMGAAGHRWVAEEHHRSKLAARMDSALRVLLRQKD